MIRFKQTNLILQSVISMRSGNLRDGNYLGHKMYEKYMFKYTFTFLYKKTCRPEISFYLIVSLQNNSHHNLPLQ